MTVATCRVTMNEWECRRPEPHSGLERRSFEGSVERTLAETLTLTGMLEVTELRAGLMVRSFSHVGTVRLGGVEVTIRPKIDPVSLLSLLRYAYGFRKLKLLPEVAHRLDRSGFADLLVSQLLAEVSELVARGLHRTYVSRSEWLSTPRGRIDLQRLAWRTGVLDAALPCTHHPRIEDTLVNKVLLAGLGLAGSMASDLMLRRESRRMVAILGGRVTPTTLNADLLDRCTRGLNRLTSAYEPALTLIRLLWESLGVSLAEGQSVSELPGFLFDMNRFFQSLLSRFLRDNLPDCTVRDEHRLRGMMQYAPGYNPRNRRAPVPRPDFVILRNSRAIAVLDAKYRDLWVNPLPRDMLFQLAVYAVGHEQRAATILYPTTETAAQEARIKVTETLFGRDLAQVCLRPVVVQKLDELITTGLSAGAHRRRTAYAEWLATGEEPADFG